jgi:chorismate synthase
VNTIGFVLRLTIFGSSHGPGVGSVLDGCPAGIPITAEMVQREVDLRKPVPGIGTARAEEDVVQVQSGLLEGRTTGAPIQFFIANRDTDSSKYQAFRVTPRPGHADYPALMKYGQDHDIRGGGQFSGRMTAPLVAAGAVARSLLGMKGIRIAAYSQAIGKIADDKEYAYSDVAENRFKYSTRAANSHVAALMEKEILAASKEGDSVGGIVRCLVEGLPVGVGEPFFDTLDGELSKMMFAIPAVKGVEFGAGFRSAKMRGSEHNDPFKMANGEVRTETNHAGGILGGLSSGMPVDLKVAFKHTASISREQRTEDLSKNEDAIVKVQGRHDPCIVPRAVVVVEAAAALVIADLSLRGGFFAR